MVVSSRVTLITFKPTGNMTRAGFEEWEWTGARARRPRTAMTIKEHSKQKCTQYTCQWITWRLNTSRAISSMSQNEWNECMHLMLSPCDTPWASQRVRLRACNFLICFHNGFSFIAFAVLPDIRLFCPFRTFFVCTSRSRRKSFLGRKCRYILTLPMFLLLISIVYIALSKWHRLGIISLQW